MFYTSTFNKVEALVRKYGTRDPFEFISAVPDMKLWVTDSFQEDGLKGFATIQNRTKYIVVDVQSAYSRMRQLRISRDRPGF